MNIEQKVKDIIVKQLGVDPEKVKLEASFVEDLGADSLDTVELGMASEAPDSETKTPDLTLAMTAEPASVATPPSWTEMPRTNWPSCPPRVPRTSESAMSACPLSARPAVCARAAASAN